jgi:hypothetical protein
MCRRIHAGRNPGGHRHPGIASAIIIPQMGTRDDMRAAAAARTLIADLIYAQNQAITSGKWVYVKFDVANNKYTLLSTASSGGDVALNHPITQTTYAQQFGAVSRGWELVSIQSAVFNGADISFRPMYTIAFGRDRLPLRVQLRERSDQRPQRRLGGDRRGPVHQDGLDLAGDGRNQRQLRARLRHDSTDAFPTSAGRPRHRVRQHQDDAVEGSGARRAAGLLVVADAVGVAASREPLPAAARENSELRSRPRAT